MCESGTLRGLSRDMTGICGGCDYAAYTSAEAVYPLARSSALSVLDALRKSWATSACAWHWFSRVTESAMVTCKCGPPKSRHGQGASISGSQTFLRAGLRDVSGGFAGSECESAGRLQLPLDLSLASDACHR